MSDMNITIINAYCCCYWDILVEFGLNLLPLFFLWVQFFSIVNLSYMNLLKLLLSYFF